MRPQLMPSKLRQRERVSEKGLPCLDKGLRVGIGPPCDFEQSIVKNIEERELLILEISFAQYCEIEGLHPNPPDAVWIDTEVTVRENADSRTRAHHDIDL